MKICAASDCVESLEGRRSDALYCSDRCRAYASDVRRGVAADKPQTGVIQVALAVPWALLALTYGALLGFAVT